MGASRRARWRIWIIAVFAAGLVSCDARQHLAPDGQTEEPPTEEVKDGTAQLEDTGVGPENAPIDFSSFDRTWMRGNPEESVATRPFKFVPYAVEIQGAEATRETWETAGYEDTYATLIEKVALDMELEDIYNYLRPPWRPSSKEVRNGLRLVPARLLKDWATGSQEELLFCREILESNRRGEVKKHRSGVFDRAYCRYESHGRHVLLMRIGDGSDDKYFGICVSLSSEECDMVANSKLDCLANYMDDLVHEVLIDDLHAPYQIRLSRKGQDGSIELRANADLPGGRDFVDSDTNPAHYLSALAGMIRKDRVVLVLPASQFFYYDVRAEARISGPGSPLVVPPMHFFDLLVGKVFDHSVVLEP